MYFLKQKYLKKKSFVSDMIILMKKPFNFYAKYTFSSNKF